MKEFCWVTVSKSAFTDERFKRLVDFRPGAVRFNSGRNSLEWINESIGKLISLGYPAERIIIDIGNSKYRVKVNKPVHVQKGQIVRICEDFTFADLSPLLDVESGDKGCFGDSQIECEIIRNKDSISFAFLNEGIITNNTAFTIRGKRKTEFGITDVEKIQEIIRKYYVGLIISFVRNVTDVQYCCELFPNAAHIIPKIETLQAYNSINNIMDNYEKIIIGRGDLSLSLGTELIGLAEMKILRQSQGKSVIVATGALTSLLHERVPSAAEVIDITTAFQNGATGILLTDETAKAEDPFIAMQWLERIVSKIQQST